MFANQNFHLCQLYSRHWFTPKFSVTNFHLKVMGVRKVWVACWKHGVCRAQFCVPRRSDRPTRIVSPGWKFKTEQRCLVCAFTKWHLRGAGSWGRRLACERRRKPGDPSGVKLNPVKQACKANQRHQIQPNTISRKPIHCHQSCFHFIKRGAVPSKTDTWPYQTKYHI